MRINEFELKRNYILNWTEGDMIKGKYLCIEADKKIAKLVKNINGKYKTFEVNQEEMKLGKPLPSAPLFAKNFWYKWTPEYFVSIIEFHGVLRRMGINKGDENVK